MANNFLIIRNWSIWCDKGVLCKFSVRGKLGDVVWYYNMDNGNKRRECLKLGFLKIGMMVIFLMF